MVFRHARGLRQTSGQAGQAGLPVKLRPGPAGGLLQLLRRLVFRRAPCLVVEGDLECELPGRAVERNFPDICPGGNFDGTLRVKGDFPPDRLEALHLVFQRHSGGAHPQAGGGDPVEEAEPRMLCGTPFFADDDQIALKMTEYRRVEAGTVRIVGPAVAEARFRVELLKKSGDRGVTRQLLAERAERDQRKLRMVIPQSGADHVGGHAAVLLLFHGAAAVDLKR